MTGLAKTLAACGFLFALRAHADNPNWPPPDTALDLSDPTYWPDDPDWDRQWNLYSFIPEAALGTVREEEIAIGAGIHADRAWQRTIGDPRVVIAVLDSGIRWSNDDLVDKIALSRGELPPPDDGCGAAGADEYDRNDDGVFSVRDYTTAAPLALPMDDTICDTRLSAADQNGNGFLDGQDLIVAFSDGVDDDGNGFLDDIAGWDALDNDNDPADDTNFGHGTGEARDSGAETDNGRGEAGVCPLCRILPTRVGQSFVVDVNDFAVGVVFAVTSGASVVQEALGSLNNSPLSRAAIDWAWANNLTIVASAADENSFHHNFPGTNNHAMYVHAIVHDGIDDDEPDDTTTTFLNFNNCTNYGAQLVLSTPGGGCSSEATGKTSGLVGLLYSAALAADLEAPAAADPATDLYGARRLGHDEVRSLLTATVDDIDIPGSGSNPDIYPSGPGWDQRFGYGRPNARSAVDAILGGDVPPAVDVTEPAWFEVLYPERTPTVTIRGSVFARGASVSGTVEWAPGIEPGDGEFSEICAITAEGPIECEWDIGDLTIDNPAMPAPDGVVNRYMVTVRVRAGAGGLPGEYRKAFHVVRDPDLVDGFPLDLGASGESSPKLVDLDGDGAREIVLATADGLVHAFRADGDEIDGFPVEADAMPHMSGPRSLAGAPFFDGAFDPVEALSSFVATPAVGDLDDDGAPEIVVADIDRKVYVFAADGTLRAGFPVVNGLVTSGEPTESNVVTNGFFASPALADLDGDGTLEIIAAGLDGKLYAWREDGSVAGGFPVGLNDPDRDQIQNIIASPAVGDVDGDGDPEIVVGTNEDYTNVGRLYVVEADGSYAGGYPVNIPSINVLPLVGTGLPSSPALGDVDGDGAAEIGVQGTALFPRILRGDGEDFSPPLDTVTFDQASDVDAEEAPLLSMISNGAFGDVDDDGAPDYVVGGAGSEILLSFTFGGRRIDPTNLVGAWTVSTGRYLRGFPKVIDDWQFFMTPAIADVDGDGHPEVISGSAGYYVRAWNGCGEEVEGFPKFTGQWIVTSPAVGDLDGDGTLELVVGTRSGWLYAWRTQGRADGRIDWEGFGHDAANTRNLATPLDQGGAKAAGPIACGGAESESEAEAESEAEGGGDEGGCCRVGRAPRGSAAPLLTLAALVLLLRRRRRS